MNRRSPLQRLRSLFGQMVVLGVLLLVGALVLGLAVGGLAQGAVVALAVPGLIALGVGLWERRRIERLARKRGLSGE
jgi:uncharacterized protein (DUF2062 family)